MNKQKDSKQAGTKPELYKLLAAVFSTKKQVVKLNDKYAARYKKWWQLSWRYIGIDAIWNKKYIHKSYILEDSKELACFKLKKWFPETEILNGC